MTSKKIMVLGGDGFCGWPTSLNLSAKGHKVLIVDNLSRRKIDIDLSTSSLTPIAPLEIRLKVWTEVSGNEIGSIVLDVANDFERLADLISDFKPEVIIHFAEQRAAPYSMKNQYTKNYTINNNINATHNILNAMVLTGSDAHLIHLGTMGVYGYGKGGIEIPEGYLKVKAISNGREVEQEILYPANPGSVYHLTKCMDQIMFSYYNKNDKIRITDLHQGIVWGTQTPETLRSESLINRFDYDGDYGTVLNRFIVESAVGTPLTVNGTGGQTRAFININDSIACIDLAINNDDFDKSRVRILNQMTEVHRVIDLAHLISNITGSEIAFLPNPRLEDPSNELLVSNRTFIDLGLKPILLEEELINEIGQIVSKYLYRVDLASIPSKSKWRS